METHLIKTSRFFNVASLPAEIVKWQVGKRNDDDDWGPGDQVSLLGKWSRKGGRER